MPKTNKNIPPTGKIQAAFLKHQAALARQMAIKEDLIKQARERAGELLAIINKSCPRVRRLSINNNTPPLLLAKNGKEVKIQGKSNGRRWATFASTLLDPAMMDFDPDGEQPDLFAARLELSRLADLVLKKMKVEIIIFLCL